MTYQQDVLDARAAADEWAAAHGLPPSGGYSGSWYVQGYLGGWWPDGWLKWWADYSAFPGSLLGGTIVGHQYTSVPVDLDAMLESEIVGPVPARPEAECASLIQSLGYISGDLLKPVAKLKLSAQPKAVRALVSGIRAQADQQGIEHA